MKRKAETDFGDLTTKQLMEIVRKYKHKKAVHGRIKKKYLHTEKGRRCNCRNARKSYYRKRINIIEAKEDKTEKDLQNIEKYKSIIDSYDSE